MDGEYRNKNCLKGRGENDVQHKTKKKFIRTLIIRHGDLGHKVQGIQTSSRQN